MTFFFIEKGSQIFCYFSAYNTRKNRLNLVFREFSVSINAQKIKFSIKDFFSKCDQMRRKLRIWSFTEEIFNGELHFIVQCI